MTTINGTLVTAPTSTIEDNIPRPSRARRRRLLTLADAVDHLLRSDEINPAETRSIERCILAVQSAKNTFITYSTQGFKYYDGRAHITFGANDDLGEVTASSDVITPTTAPSWPSWMEMGQIRVDEKTYPVISYTSTTATVEGLPDDTYSAATLQQGFARLPKDFRRRGSLTDGTRTYPVVDVPTGILRSWEDYYEWANSAANPITFGAIAGDKRFQGELMLSVWPPYATAKTLSLHYERYMSELDYHRVGSGTVTTSGTSFTTTDAILKDEYIGCAISFSTDATAEILSSLSARSLVSDQRIITDITDTTNGVMDKAVTGDVDAKSFYISDVVDVMPGPMEEAFLALCEWELSKDTKSKKSTERYAEFRHQMDIAMADDARYRDSIDDTPYVTWGYGVGEVTGRPDL